MRRLCIALISAISVLMLMAVPVFADSPEPPVPPQALKGILAVISHAPAEHAPDFVIIIK